MHVILGGPVPLLTAIRIIRWQQVYVQLPCCMAMLFVLAVIFLGGLYAGGAIRKETYVGILIAGVIVFAAALIGTAGYYFFVRRMW